MGANGPGPHAQVPKPGPTDTPSLGPALWRVHTEVAGVGQGRRLPRHRSCSISFICRWNICSWSLQMACFVLSRLVTM